MTKFEWDRQFKKGISSLPQGEQRRVLEYYNELFSDKIDAGMKEEEIIAEFGNPYDVANKLLVDYYNEEKGSSADDYVYSSAEPMDEVFDGSSKAAPRETNRRTHVQVNKNTKSAGGLITLICILLFFVLGACFNKWHPAWMLFLCIPVVITFVEALEKRNWRIFCYPVFIVIVYLLLGFYAHLWHPMWILFLTIPLYYVVGSYVSKSTAQEQPAPTERVVRNVRTSTAPQAPVAAKRGVGVGRTIAGIILAVVLVSLLIVVWWVVIWLFVAGIVMIGGGVIAMIVAFIGMAESFATSMIILGGSLAVLGLGFVFTFGMSSVFKYCASMSRSFGKSISACFGKEV